MLFSSRWVLAALGDDDYGLYSVVGGLIVFILFIRTVTANSSQRFFAYAIGEGNMDNLKRWFNFSFEVHIFITVLLLIIGIPIGNYFIDNVLNISENRLLICHWVFYLSVISAVITAITTPGYAMLIARQRLFELALWETLRGIFVFIFSWYLLYAQGDLLLIYSIGIVSITSLINIIQYIRATILYPECSIKLKYWFDKSYLNKFVFFSWWLSFAALCAMIRNQGIMILINIFHGAKVNAALGIANNVSSHTSSLSSAIYSAVAPEMTISEGSGNRKRVEMLSVRTSKFITLLTFFWFIPLFFEMDYVLGLWLKNVPAHTTAFCKIILIVTFIEKITVGQVGAMHAMGKIGRFEGSIGVLYAMVLPIAWLFLKYGYSPEIALCSMILVGIFITYGRLFWLKKLMNIGYWIWLKEVFFKGILVCIPSILSVLLIQNFLSPSLQRLFFSTVLNAIITSITAYCYGLSNEERDYFISKLKKLNIFHR